MIQRYLTEIRIMNMRKKVAEETIVLLKNEDGLLPLSEKEEIAFYR